MPGSRAATVLDDLPEWLVVDEILARLPVKDVFRCRAVRRSWRSGTSTYAFILGHHRRQPSLPIILHDHGISRVAGASASASSGQKIRPLLRYASLGICMRFITCDGLLILWRGSDFYICNPATRKCAPLSHPPRQQFISPITGVDVLGLYRHQPSGEYRVLWVSYAAPMGTFAAVKVEQPHYLVFTVGSDQPRRIQWPTVSEDGCPAAHPPIHHRGSLHWAMGCSITVFETIAETFRQMSRPAQLGSYVLLLDTGDNLALYVSTDHDRVTLDVWVLQDYDAETWGFRYRINLLAMDASPPLKLWKSIPRLAVINERELLMAQPPRRLLHCDIDGVFLGNVESEEHENRLTLSWHRFQESMISVPLFEAQEEDAVSNEPPFVMVL
ncbi:F-box protein At5g49610-like [Aegilops tauschii subsp. strangulata]|uniref:F-box protein At5g49610-like n=1 Tax=Aegilops tauschii subsp. strangulata TaxID=200361 RepID=UPI00098A6068